MEPSGSDDPEASKETAWFSSGLDGEKPKLPAEGARATILPPASPGPFIGRDRPVRGARRGRIEPDGLAAHRLRGSVREGSGGPRVDRHRSGRRSGEAIVVRDGQDDDVAPVRRVRVTRGRAGARARIAKVPGIRDHRAVPVARASAVKRDGLALE